jgi:hypothetical protein
MIATNPAPTGRQLDESQFADFVYLSFGNRAGAGFFRRPRGTLGQAIEENHRRDGAGEAARKAQGTGEDTRRNAQSRAAQIGGSAQGPGAEGRAGTRSACCGRSGRASGHRAAAAELPAFAFDGGKTVQTSSDPVQLYKGFVEYTLRSKWNRPLDIDDTSFVAEVEVKVDRSGDLSDPIWKKSSGNTRWDDSVRQAIASTPELERHPPASFPGRVLVRFDVQETTEPLLQ